MPRLKKQVKKGIRCEKCNTKRSYFNPMAQCQSCQKTFCFDHINGKISNSGVIDLCNECYAT